MGLFTVNLSNEDRQRVDRALDLVEEMKHITTELVRGYELVVRLSLEPKLKKDDIQK
jgi:hypothetical protein